MKTRKSKETKAITLVSLVITIIILLILAGVALNLVVGEEGIIKRTSDSKDQYEVSRDKEIINLALATAQMTPNYKNYNAQDIEEALAGQDVQNVTQRGNNISLTLNGRDYRIKPDGEVIEYTYIDTPTDIYWKFEDGILYLRSTQKEGYIKNTYTADTNWRLNIDMSQVREVTIEETIAPKATANWFNGCSNLAEIQGMNKLHTENVTNMNYTFANCTSFMQLNVSSFDTSLVESMYGIFLGCNKIESIDLSSFDTKNVTNMAVMFYSCGDIESLDLSNFNTSNVINMESMFNRCYRVKELRLDSFNTENVKNMYRMFFDCNNLKTIYVSNNFVVNNVESDKTDEVFKGCNCLIGGKGTLFNVSNIDITYAHIDNPPDAPGYFTLKP